jgi:branched-chain amino acid transport system substrate-binding protein
LPILSSFHGGMTDYFVPTALSKSNPEAAEAMLGTFAPIMYAYDIPNPENEKFVKDWTEKFGEIPGGTNLPGSTYQALLLLKTAIESLNGNITSSDELVKAIETADVKGPQGHLMFEGSHAATKDVHIVQVVKLDDGSYNYKTVKTYKDVPPTGLQK